MDKIMDPSRSIVQCLLLGILFIAVVLVLPVKVEAQMPTNALEGTWRMMSQERVYPDSVVDRSDQWGANFKILNSTHFAWGRETNDGEEVLAGGGRYEYHPDKNIYIEHIEYHSSPGFRDVSIQFTARVEGDTWTHIGDVGSYKLREVWRRVDPQEARDRTTSQSTVNDLEQ